MSRSSRRTRLSMSQQRSLWGYLFALPFIVGYALFFLYPFVQSFVFSFNEMQVGGEGYILEYVGLGNYRDALLVHTTYLRVLTETLLSMAADVPLVIMFSFFAASLLNQKFKGRLLARMIFFLPVIVSSGVILRMEQGDYMMSVLQPGGAEGGLLGSAALRSFLFELKIPEDILQYVIGAVDRIPEIIRASGIQILVFLAGLQSIRPELYEAAEIEGATGWECFWKLTFPLMSPLLITNIVYTVIDSFTAADNRLIEIVRDTAFTGMGFGVSAAMAWIYFLCIGIVLASLTAVLSRWVVYQE